MELVFGHTNGMMDGVMDEWTDSRGGWNTYLDFLSNINLLTQYLFKAYVIQIAVHAIKIVNLLSIYVSKVSRLILSIEVILKLQFWSLTPTKDFLFV